LPSPSLAPLPIPGGDRPPTAPPVRSPVAPKPSPIPPPIANREPKVNSQVAAIVQNSQILPNGIGTARIGMTLGELRRQIGDRAQFQKIQEFIPDHNAIAVRQGGQVQYYIVYDRYSDFGDNDKIQYLITDNRNYRTEQGVGPGSSISDAEKTYGRPTLSYSRENESRETVRFPQTPSLTFLPARSRGFAGIYPPANDTEYQQTNRYQPQATISRVIVTCPEENCN
jgi:hypothetical protein